MYISIIISSSITVINREDKNIYQQLQTDKLVILL